MTDHNSNSIPGTTDPQGCRKDRRRFLGAGAAATPFLMTMVSQPALGVTCFTPSRSLSKNTSISQQGKDGECTGAESPGNYKMEVMQTNAVDFNVSVRGNNQVLANNLLILVDGRSIYLDQAGNTIWKLLPVTLAEIKRIEVLKGPASAVYGFNAFDGVINIITKSPEEMKGTTLQVAGGDMGTLLTSVVQAGTVRNWGYRLSGGHEQTQRWSDRDAPALNGQRIGGRVDYHLPRDRTIRAEGGIGRANPYNGFVREASVEPYGEKHKLVLQGIVENKIIVGHDLTHDMKMLGIKHSAFIDTVWLLPHHFGLPNKNKIKNLALEVLNKHIQWGTHDPFVDSLTALQIA